MDIEARKNSIFSINPIVSCLISVFVYLLVIVVKHQYLISNDQLLAEYTGTNFDEYKSATNTFRSFKYFFLLIAFFASILIMFFLMSITNFVVGTGLPPKELFNLAVFCISLEIVSEVFTICWFASLGTFHSSEVFNFHLGSAFSLAANNEDLAFPKSYILQSIDFFLVLKICLIGYSYYYLTDRSILESFLIMVYTYLAPLLIFYFFVYQIS